MVVFNQLPTRYSEGTASVAANAMTVTGTGTNWTVLQPGDLFGVHKGLAIPIASISTDGLTLTLAYPWPGVAQTNAAYCVQLVPRSVGVQEATRQLLLMLANGRIDDFVNLAAAADKLPYFDGPDSMALADFPAAARTLLAGGQLPNTQVRNDLTPDKAFRRGNILGTVAQSSGVPTGAIIERGNNANGEYVRFADKTQICTKSVATGDPTINAGAFAVISTSSYSASFAVSPQQFLAYDGSWAPVALVNNEGKSASATGSLIISNQDTVAHQFVGVFNVFAIGRWY